MRTLLSAIVILLSTQLRAQEPLFTWGRAEKKPFPETEVRILGSNKDGYYLVQKKGPGAGEFSPTIAVEHFTMAHVRDLSVTLAPDNRYDFVDIVVFEGKPWMLLALFDKSLQKNRLMATPVVASGSATGDEIASIPAEKLAARGSFKAVASPDGHKLAILAQPAFKKEMKEPGTITLFSGSFANHESGEISFSNNWTRDISNSLLLNNEGTLFIVKRSEPKGYTSFSVASWRKGALKEFPMNLEANQKFASLAQSFAANGDLLTGAYYTEENKIDFIYGTPSHGTVLQRISADGSTQKFFSAQPFQKRDKMVVRNVLATDDRYVLLAEHFQREDIGPKRDYNGNIIPFERDYSYFGDDIVVDGFDASGKLLYTQKIDKRKYTVNDNGILHGFTSGIVGNQVLVLFNDDLWKHDGKKKLIRFGTDYLVPALARIDLVSGKMEAVTGLLNTGSVGGKNGDMPLRPGVFLQVDDRSFIIRGEHREIYKMGTVRF
jgi:hypothetical protein